MFKLTVKTPEWHHWRPAYVLLVNCELTYYNIPDINLVRLFLTLNMYLLAGLRKHVNLEHIVSRLL